MAINQLQFQPFNPSVPQVDFTPLSQLGEIYKKSQLDAALQAEAEKIKGGAPVNYQGLGTTLLGAGKIDPALSLFQLGQQQTASADFGRDLSSVFGGGAQPAANPSGATPPNANLPNTQPLAQAGLPVPSSRNVWGDTEATAAGLYDPVKPAIGPLPAQQAPAGPAQPPMATNSPVAPVVSGPSMGGVPLANAVPALIRAMSNQSLPASQKEVAKTLLVKALDDSKFTDDQKEYIFDQTLGGKFGTWKAEIKKAGATKVEVNTGDKAYENKVGGAFGEQFVEYHKNSQKAGTKLNTLKYMEGLIDRPGFYSGTGGELVNQGNRALVSMGLKDPKAASGAEVFSSLSNQIVLDSAGGSLGNAISNADRTFIEGTVPNLARTPEGNRELINISKKMAQREQEVAKLVTEYAKRNGGKLDAGFQDHLAQWAEANPLFPQAQQQAAPAPQPPPTGLPRATNKAEFDKLPPKARFIGPDGQEWTKP